MNRDTWVVIALAILIVLGGWLWYANSATSTLSYFLTQQGDRQHRESTDLYTIQLVYPDTTPLSKRSGAVAEGRAENAINALLNDLIKQFKDEIRAKDLSAEEQAKIASQGPKFSLNVQYHAFSSGSFVSYEFDVFFDTGGAHPGNLYKTIVFDIQGNTVGLGDLFSGAGYLERISTETQAQVIAQLQAQGVPAATSTIAAGGVAPQAANFENFVVDSDRIRIFIPPGQVAAYAAGPFEIQLPLVDIKDILKSNVK